MIARYHFARRQLPTPMDITALLLIYWLPLGLLLIAWGSWDNDRLRDNAVTALTVIATAAIAYAGLGFGLQFGGIGLRPDSPAGLQGLDRMWALSVGPTGRWGLFGLEGFLLQTRSTSPHDTALISSLFLHQLPLILTATLFPGLALAGRARLSLIVFVSFLCAGFLIPLAGAWAWGGGWLSTLGANARLGKPLAIHPAIGMYIAELEQSVAIESRCQVR